MASSTGSLDHGGFTFTPPPFITSFTELLSGTGDMLGGGGGGDHQEHRSPRGLFHHHRGVGVGVPKFKSAQPPSLPLSPPPMMSPSAYFAIPAGLSPAELLDSPVLLHSSSSILASPTTGAIPAQRFDWKQAAADLSSRAAAGFGDFSFHTAAPAATSNAPQPEQQQAARSAAAPSSHKAAAAPSSNINGNSNTAKLEDGYNWRKYGQKQVKGSENPRSYYKCTYHSCSMKKKVERSLADGRITQIVYKGAHNHPKPLSTRRNSSGAGAAADDQAAIAANSNSCLSAAAPEHSGAENSSVTFGDDEAENNNNGGGSPQRSGDGEEPDAKRWKDGGGGGENDEGSSGAGSGGSKAVREPRLVVQTLSDIDILDDGFRWRKYGQKVVKGNPNPRSYYKCTTPGCPVRKHVERASHDARAVITTYEGKHNHDVPVGRGGAASRAPAAAPAFSAGGGQQQQQQPYTLEMLGGGGYAAAKDEPRDDLFVDSLLC